jgi:dipeptidyl aminopeptidase/acylaminoacyl peptidase
VVVYVHGGPTSVTYDEFDPLLHHLVRGHGEAGRIGADGFIVVAPNPSGSLGFGEHYRRSVAGDWGGRMVEDVLSVVDEVVEQIPMANLSRVFLIGRSAGGYVTNILATRDLRSRARGVGSVTVKGIASFYGVSRTRTFPCETDQKWFSEFQFGYSRNCDTVSSPPYRPEQDPAMYLRCASPPCTTGTEIPLLLVHGSEDQRVRIAESQAMARGLRNFGPGTGDASNRDTQWPFRACEVRNGVHGFGVNTQVLLYRSTVDWFECVSRSDFESADSCELSSSHDVEASSVKGEVLDCRSSVKEAWIAATR